jgi:pimeloyl-ACP methyl ester carboxylesterase
MAKRLDVDFFSGGTRCSAWLYLPDGGRPAPVIVMAHGLGGVRTMRLDAFAERFCEEGYACLVFDYRNFGDSDGEPRQVLDIGAQLEDWRAAIAFARKRPEVDGSRLVVWGTSLGGGHAIAVAAADPEVAAMIAQCPYTDNLASALAISPFVSIKLAAMALIDQLGAWLGARPLLVATAGKPGSAALMTAHDVVPGYRALVPPGSQIRGEVAARIALRMLFYRPGSKAAKLACPALFCVCERDTVAPAWATLEHAKRAPKGEIVRYPIGHFDIYVGQCFNCATADQIAFLRRHVPARPRG